MDQVLRIPLSYCITYFQVYLVYRLRPYANFELEFGPATKANSSPISLSGSQLFELR